MILFYLFAWCSGLIYLAFLIIVHVGLRTMPRSRFEEDDEKLPSVSVVIAARDEETRIGRLLDSLQAQDYPRDRVEIIVVDDRSRDATAEFVSRNRPDGIPLRVLRIRDGETPRGRSPKKYALSRGIDLASGEVIVTTDADCWMGPRWLRALVSPFVDPEVHGATGVSRFVWPDDTPKRWWSDLESIEHLSYSIAAMGTIGVGHVFNAHGSNLAARKSVYERIGGYRSNERVASGDDVFLLQDIAASGGKVVFIDRPEGYVFSQPVSNLREWVHQRARWSSKGFYYPPFILLLVVGTYAFSLALLIGTVLALFSRFPWRLLAGMAGFKMAAESILMEEGCERLGERFPFGRFLLGQILHTPALLAAGIRGQFFSFSWKGQQFSGLDGFRNGNRKPRPAAGKRRTPRREGARA